MVGGSVAGFDRIYLGCHDTGFMKLALFLFVVAVAVYEWYTHKNKTTTEPATKDPTEPATEEATEEPLPDLDDADDAWLTETTLRMLAFLALWSFIDSAFIFFNALSGSASMPYSYCNDSGTKWVGASDVRSAKMVAFLMIVVTLVSGIFLPSTLLTQMEVAVLKGIEKLKGNRV